MSFCSAHVQRNPHRHQISTSAYEQKCLRLKCILCRFATETPIQVGHTHGRPIPYLDFKLKTFAERHFCSMQKCTRTKVHDCKNAWSKCTFAQLINVQRNPHHHQISTYARVLLHFCLCKSARAKMQEKTSSLYRAHFTRG